MKRVAIDVRKNKCFEIGGHTALGSLYHKLLIFSLSHPFSHFVNKHTVYPVLLMLGIQLFRIFRCVYIVFRRSDIHK